MNFYKWNQVCNYYPDKEKNVPSIPRAPRFCPFPFIILWKPLAGLLTQYKYLLFLKKNYINEILFFQVFNYGIFLFPCFCCLLWEVSYDSYCCSPGYNVLADWATAFNISSFLNIFLFLTALGVDVCGLSLAAVSGGCSLVAVRGLIPAAARCRAPGCTGFPSRGAKA